MANVYNAVVVLDCRVTQGTYLRNRFSAAFAAMLCVSESQDT